MKKEISTMLIDGKEYRASKDKKYIEGKEKNFKIEEFRKEKGEKVPIVAVPPETTKDGVVYGFSDEKKFENWLKENRLDKGYDRYKKILERAKVELPSEKMEKIKKHQIKVVKEATERFNKFLEKNNLKSEEIEKIEKVLVDEHDPYSMELWHNSAYLYDHTWWQGVMWKLPGNWDFGLWYPDLSYFGCNDKASSISTWFSQFVNLFSDTWYRGNAVHVWIALSDLDTWWGNWLGNRASSAAVF